MDPEAVGQTDEFKLRFIAVEGSKQEVEEDQDDNGPKCGEQDAAKQRRPAGRH